MSLQHATLTEPLTEPSSRTFSETPLEQLDRAIAELGDRKDAWVQVPIPQRIAYLRQCMVGVMAVAAPWATAACAAKGIDPTSSLAGEEWIAGPLAVLLNLRMLIHSLNANGQPEPVSRSTQPNGQVIAQVFPDNLADQLLWLGFKGEVWVEPGQPATQGLVYRQKSATGNVSLVLGAGNINAISAMDTLYKLFAEDEVVLLKMNPVNAYVGEFLEKAFQPLIADGFFNVVYGGAEVGRYLCQHPGIATIHITGAQQTHDAIVWGSSPAEQQQRQATHAPLVDKPITSELGCVTPILIVPGDWSAADLAFQARHVASMVAHNASFNCVAAKVVVTATGWKQRDEFLNQLHQELAKTPSRKAYYPGAKQRYQAFLDRYPQAQALGDTRRDVPWTVIPDVPADAAEYALNIEAFCGVLAEVSLDASDATEFLTKAVEFANESVWGNLSCALLIDAKTQKHCRAELETAIAQLDYGAIGVNVWTGMNFLLSAVTWGAFPGNLLTDVRSGRGVVHNTYLFEHPQKSVVRAPFRIFPTPIWFADHKNLLQVAQRFAAFEVAPSVGKFLGVVLAALKG
ncbi:MAG: aldehyde dehydrogenase family protein [Leptolyngbyaceae cyanobacterium RU_5_1]|nr:aldehyde dehydrogenase family protein [Leptolyngbyaceae cyanobacterium RU_5_1]